MLFTLKRSLGYWLFGGALLLLSVVLLRGHIDVLYWGATPKRELLMVEGIPDDAMLEEITGQSGHKTYTLEFRISEHRIKYSSIRPKYREVLAAIESGEPILMGLSKEEETFFNKESLVPFYTLSVGDKSIISYDETIARKSEALRFAIIIDCFLLGLGAFCAYVGFRKNRKSSSDEDDPPLDPMKKISRGTTFLSIAFYAVLIAVKFDPNVHAKLVEAFGAAPFGIPVLLVVILVESLLYLPVPWFFWHWCRIIYQAIQDGRKPGIFYLFTVGTSHPHLRRSQLISLLGILYFFAILIAWVSYTSARGI